METVIFVFVVLVGLAVIVGTITAYANRNEQDQTEKDAGGAGTHKELVRHSRYCPKCGGSLREFGEYNLVIPNVSIYDPEPFCPKCGGLKNIPCYACDGKGYTLVPVISGTADKYCSSCGRKLNNKTKRQICPKCVGTGSISHICTGI